MPFTLTETVLDSTVGPLTYWLHPPQAENARLLLTFSSTRQASFHEEPYDIPARLFAEAGQAVVSFDLPNHGEQVNHFGEGIEGMCKAFCAGEDPFTQFVAQGRAVLDACLASGIGRGGIVACGVSRAGYCALRLAAADPRIRAVAALAPVTDWRALREFAAVRDDAGVAALALDHWAQRLAGRAIFLAIGNHDLRVSSTACVQLVMHLLEIEESAGSDSSAVEFYVVPEVGHSLSADWRRAGAEFLLNH